MPRFLRVPAATLGLLLLTSLLSMGGCNFKLGSGGFTGNLDLHLPYVEQPPGSLLCGEACILMWRQDDKMSSVSLPELERDMNCNEFVGCSLDQIRWGVNAFTISGRDAHLEWVYDGEGDLDVLKTQFHAREITSMNSGIPVIATINNDSHATVPDRGNYTTAPDGLKRWDYVDNNDPILGRDMHYTAGEWLTMVDHQIISTSAETGWLGNYDQYGNIHIRGDRSWPPDGTWPPEY